MKSIGGKKTGIGIAIVVIIQIFLMINYVTANSFLISEANNFNFNSRVEDKKAKEILSGLGNIFLGLFSIKQIGSVSAFTLNCCEKKDGAWCIEAEDANDCNQNYRSIPSTCNDEEGEAVASFCTSGTCIINEGELCTSGSIKTACEEGGGEWDPRGEPEIPECRRGACVLGDEASFITEKQCEILSQDEGVEKNFRPEFDTEFATLLLSEALSSRDLLGACVSDLGDCRVTRGENCDIVGGMEFFPGLLCTNPTLEENYGVECEPVEETTCLDGEDEIYFKDSCGNYANIYDADMTFDGEFGDESKEHVESGDINRDDYWAYIVPKGKSCGVGDSNADSETCGNCQRSLSSVCSVTEEGDGVEHGNNICKDLTCDYKGETYNSGESWCVYESKIGDARDTPGSEHFKATCTEGELEIITCGSGGRTQVCTQSTTEEEVNGEIFTGRTAQCVVNEAPRCINYNPLTNEDGDDVDEHINDCQSNNHCMVKRVDVAEYFDFKVCVPKYPKGNSNYCSIASTKCPIVYEKNADQSWSVIANGHCDSSEFSRKMSDLCVSLGDCGSYVNYIGDGTNNEVVDDKKGGKEGKGHPDPVSWTRYRGNEDYQGGVAEPGSATRGSGSGEIETGRVAELEDAINRLNEVDVTETGRGTPFSSTLIDIADAIIPEEAATDSELRNSVGTAGSITWAIGYFNLFGGSLTASTSGSFLSEAGFINGYATSGGPSWLGWGAVAAATVVGAIAGAYIARELGIGGDPAAAMTIAGAVAGGTAAYAGISAGSQIFTTSLAISGIGFWAAVGVIAVIVISGVGQREKREITFTCNPWQAPTGVSDETCNKCHEDSSKKCTTYRCESLGQNCEIRNEGEERPICIAVNTDDITPPVVHVNSIDEEHRFTLDDFDSNREIGIENADGGCLEEYSDVEFSIKTEEFSQCRWSLDRNELEGEFDDLTTNFFGDGTGSNLFKEEHSMNYEVPSYESADSNGEITLNIKCQDAMGNPTLKVYGVNMCIKQQPDETAPSIVQILPESGSNVKYGESWKEIDLYINEREDSLQGTECRYSSTAGTSFENMDEGSCTVESTGFGADIGYLCDGMNLTGLEGGENKYYIRCKDGIGNTYSSDYEYSLNVPETPLTINSVSAEIGDDVINVKSSDTDTPEIKGGGGVFTTTLRAQTAGGISGGVSECEYRLDEGRQWAIFQSDFPSADSSSHEQTSLNLERGKHNIGIRCEDDAGNIAEATAEFRLTIDNDAPRVVRAFSSGGISLATNEDAKCYASLDAEKGCGFDIDDENVISMTGIASKEHSSSSSSQKTHYVKCVDLFGNENAGCAIKISPEIN